MRNLIIGISLLGLAATAPAYAAQSSKEEAVGVGTGALVGALAGGPVGLVVGAAIGAKLGDTLHRKEETIGDLAASLSRSQSEGRQLHARLDHVTRELGRMQATARPELVRMLEAGIAMDLLFRTDEHVLAETTSEKLAALAGTLANMPAVRVQLDGFADERGDETYNQALSAQRVEFVRQQLVAAGISPSRIEAAAHGESVAEDASIDSYALERRVSLTLFIDDSPSMAQLP